ncbi:MAG: aldo/keto reductase [Acidobacteriota bacterium]
MSDALHKDASHSNWPRLGLGTVAFGRDWGLKYPVRIPDDAALERLLDLAADLGVTHLDTAPAYGASEERLGRLLARRPGRFTVSTKVGEVSTPRGSRFDFSPAAIRHSVEASLKRLRADVLDLVFLHSSGDDARALEGLDALLDLRAEGKLRLVGASTKTVQGGLDAVRRCDAVMIAYSHRDRSQAAVLEAASGSVPVFVKKPLDAGGVTPEGVAEALAFVARHPAVTTVLVGTTDPEHLRANARVVGEAVAE